MVDATAAAVQHQRPAWLNARLLGRPFDDALRESEEASEIARGREVESMRSAEMAAASAHATNAAELGEAQQAAAVG